MPEIKLIDLPVTRACIVKWNRGKATHGEKFEGDPLEELFGELIDGLNYADQAELEGFDMGEIRCSLWNLAHDVQALAENRTTAEELTEDLEADSMPVTERTCRVCGCTDGDCSQCIAKTGQPCHWVADDLCSACADEVAADPLPVTQALLTRHAENVALLARHAGNADYLEDPGGCCD